MPVQEGGPQAGAQPSKDIGAAIDFVKKNPSGFFVALRTIGAFFVALFSKKKA